MKVYCLFVEVTDIYEHDNYRQNLFNKKLVAIYSTKQNAEQFALDNGYMLLGSDTTIGTPAVIEEIDIPDLTVIRLVTAIVLERDNEYVFDFGAMSPLSGRQIVVRKTPGKHLQEVINDLLPTVRDLYYAKWHEFSTQVYIDEPHCMLASIPVTESTKGVNIAHFPVIGNALG